MKTVNMRVINQYRGTLVENFITCVKNVFSTGLSHPFINTYLSFEACEGGTHYISEMSKSCSQSLLQLNLVKIDSIKRRQMSTFMYSVVSREIFVHVSICQSVLWWNVSPLLWIRMNESVSWLHFLNLVPVFVKVGFIYWSLLSKPTAKRTSLQDFNFIGLSHSASLYITTYSIG